EYAGKGAATPGGAAARESRTELLAWRAIEFRTSGSRGDPRSGAIPANQSQFGSRQGRIRTGAGADRSTGRGGGATETRNCDRPETAVRALLAGQPLRQVPALGTGGGGTQNRRRSGP